MAIPCALGGAARPTYPAPDHVPPIGQWFCPTWRMSRRKRCPRTWQLSPGQHLVGCKVVGHDNVVAFEDRNQTLLDIGQEHLSGHSAFDHHRRRHLVVTQGGHEGDRLPVPKRGQADQPDASRRTPSEPHHIGGDRGLVDEHQVGGIKHALFSDPASARTGDVCSLPLRRLQTLFFEGDVVASIEPRQCAPAGPNAPLAQFCDRLQQDQVRLRGQQSQNLLRFAAKRFSAPIRGKSRRCGARFPR